MTRRRSDRPPDPLGPLACNGELPVGPCLMEAVFGCADPPSRSGADRRRCAHGCVIVALQLDRSTTFTAPQVQRALLKDLADRPYGIVCDLTGVDSLDPVCADGRSPPWPTIPPATGRRPASCCSGPGRPWPRCWSGSRRRTSCRSTTPSRTPSTGSRTGRPSCATSSASPRRRPRRPRPGCTSATCSSTGGSPCPKTASSTGPSCSPTSWSPTPSCTPGPPCGCGWSCTATSCTSPCTTPARGCCAWSPTTPTARPAAACGWSSGSPPPRGCSRRPDGGKVVWCTLRLWRRPGPACAAGAVARPRPAAQASASRRARCSSTSKSALGQVSFMSSSCSDQQAGDRPVAVPLAVGRDPVPGGGVAVAALQGGRVRLLVVGPARPARRRRGG